MDKTLLPSGLYDLLPPTSRQESHIINKLMECFASFGYEQVSPPLLEFEDTLFAGRGETLAQQTFRVMDPASQRMMGFRPDMTLQVARIALSRMEQAPRPLRLCYAGPALRVNSEKLRTERQLTQAGVELIGSTSPNADAEVIRVVAEALQKLGISGISIDLNLPGLVPHLLDESALKGDARQLAEQAIARKDAVALESLNFKYRDALISLLSASGNAAQVMPKLLALDLPVSAQPYIHDLRHVIGKLTQSQIPVALTVDATEFRGFEYHKGIGFSIFAGNVRDELGRGGRYPLHDGDSTEATGFTLYVGTLLSIVATPQESVRVFVPAETTPDTSATLRAEGYVTVHALTDSKDDTAEARRLRCTHLYSQGKVVSL